MIILNQLNHEPNKKKFTYYWMICKMFFFLQKYLKEIFYIVRGFYMLTKILNTARLLLKWNKTCCIEFSLVKIFVSFVKLLSISLNKFSHFQGQVFLTMIASEQKRLVLLSRMIINNFVLTANIQLGKFVF